MARILKRPMFRRGGMPSNQGVTAVRPQYMGGGMGGIMSGIVPRPDAGLTPRVGIQDGGNIGGGSISGNLMGSRTGFETPRIVGQGPYLKGSSYGKGFNITRLPATTPGVPANVANAGQKIVNAANKNYPLTVIEKATKPSKFAGILNKLKKIPGAAKFAGLTKFGGPYLAAAGAGYGIGELADYVTKSGDTPEAYALRKQIMREDPYTFDETNLEVGDAIARIEAADVGEKYGFLPRGGKEQRLKDLGLEGKFDAKTGERIKEQEVVENPQEEIPKEKQQDPEKSLMDIYGENKGIIDQVMGNSDEDTKKSLYLQLAKFGAGLAAQPGGDLVGAIGKAAMPAIEGTEKTLADKKKGDREVKLMALSKTFEDMKQPEQIKTVKAIQKEFGFDTFKEAYEYISKQKKSGAQLRDEDKFYRETAKEMGVSTDGFRREMQALDEMGLGAYVGNFTRPDALLPEDIDDRVPGEYYVNTKGKPLRFIDGKLYGPKEKQFTKKIETKET
jgi:hypothetical protein